ncbi:MAG: two-component system chemotaxis sensor kinase CheA [Sulfurimonas sp.]|jgi:two-component system chemotaxis sensor kinase CheA|uniref:ATP-binding protein n=1 Tax=Sulfurimonas sp. TaxID=2022749 RepID=UPI0039E60434
MLSKEEILIQEYEDLLDSQADISFTAKELARLLKAYKRSYKQLNKIIKISDKQQDELKEISENLNAKTHKVRSLLDNAEQGFLSFGDDFIIDDEYSKECERLLGTNLEGKDISDVLYTNDETKKHFLKEALLNVVNEKDELIKDAMLSLLPKEVIVNRRAIKVDYKVLNNKTYMIVLTNITKEKILEKKIAKEQEILKMIVIIVSEPTQFYELKDDFEKFSKNKRVFISLNLSAKENLSELYRDIHTFKGSFSQLRMQNCVKELHNLETKLSTVSTRENLINQDLVDILDTSDTDEWLKKDLYVIKEILGIEFFDKQHKIEVDDKFIFNIEDKITYLLQADNQHINTYEDILNEINRARGTTLNHALSIYPKLCQEIASSQEKNLMEFKVVGGEDILTPIHFKPFIKSLIHLFRNAIDHGVEDLETRLILKKNEYASITCNIENNKNNFKIIIEDDGAGIDIEKLKLKVFRANVYTEFELLNMSEAALFELVFIDNLSTNDSITRLSGRGIGMGAVKAEIEKLSGEIEIQSIVGEGSKFILKVPTSTYGNLINIASNNRDNITIEYILSPVVNRATTYLQSDMKINIKNKAEFSYALIDDIQIKEYCSYIHISGLVDVSVCISYDQFLLDKLLNEFNHGHPINDSEVVEYRESISKEVINIIVGNALFNPYDKTVLEITTPCIIKHDELITHNFQQNIAHVVIDTEYGEMQILVGKF